jgi:hypothetical protein
MGLLFIMPSCQVHYNSLSLNQVIMSVHHTVNNLYKWFKYNLNSICLPVIDQVCIQGVPTANPPPNQLPLSISVPYYTLSQAIDTNDSKYNPNSIYSLVVDRVCIQGVPMANPPPNQLPLSISVPYYTLSHACAIYDVINLL